jgi:predicted RNase H-like HicB family nuclease
MENVLVSPEKYTYRVFWSEEDQEFVGACAEFPSLSWLAESQAEALSGIGALVADTLEDLQQSGEPIPQPISQKSFSGTLSYRPGPELHRRLAMEAAEAGTSITRVINNKLLSCV